MKAVNLKTKLVSALLGSMIAGSAMAIESAQIKAPIRAVSKPDLIVYYVNSYYPVGNEIKVTVRNNGNAKSGSAVLTVTAGRMKGEASIIALEPNHAMEPTIKFDKPLQKGMMLTVVVDSKNHVDESNENNNTKTHTY